MKKIFTLLAALLLTAPYVSAVPAIRRPVTFTQSDGTQITIRIVGDEYRHYPVSSDGYTLAGGGDGDLYYATLSTTGELVPTSVKARPIARLSSEERSKVSKLAKEIKPTSGSKMELSRTHLRSSFAQGLQTRADGTLTPPARFSEATAIGKLKSLVILVNYKDTKFNAANGKQSFQNLLMQDGYNVNGATGSAWNYYQDNSNKQFDPDFIVAGPYTLSKGSSYYAGKDGTDNVAEMIVEAAKMADADINFAEYADNGVIRNVFVFFAGKNQAETGITTTVWPHQWDVRAGNYYVQLDGQLLAGYACSSELNGRSQFAGIGTFCHEFGHVLGWPDFYDTDYTDSGGEADAMENYTLMCSGSYNNDGRTPPAVNMLERWMMGWATPEDISAGGTHTLDPVWKDKGYIVRTPTTNDYFILEGRAMGSFKWDNYIEDSYGNVNPNAKGLFVYHVDYTKPSQWQNNILNNNPSHECTKIIRSVPGSASAGKPISTFFPGTKNVTTLSSTSNTGFKSWLNAAPLTSFTNISISGEQIVLVSPGGVTPDPVFNVTETTINSNDALLKWSYSVAAASWQVTWKTNGQQVGTKTVTEAQILIEGLTPSTKYDVTFKTGDKEYSYSFTTKVKEPVAESETPLISFPADIESGKPVTLSIGGNTDMVSGTEWIIDGQKITGSQVTFTAGEYKLMATLTLNDGTKQHIIKFITVK